MKALKKQGFKGFLALFLTAALAWLIVGPAFAAAAEGEAGVCQRAWQRCLAEAIISGLLSWGVTIVFYVSFCFIGLDFCLKYVDNYV